MIVTGFDVCVYWICKVLGILAAGAIMIMMISVAADVIGRYVFSHPILGAMELALLLMVVVVYLGLPVTQLEQRHITIDVLYNRLPSRLRTVINIISSFIVLGVGIILAWQAIKYALKSVKIGEYISGMASFPKYPSKIALAIGAIIFALAVATQLLRLFMNKTSTRDQ